MKTVGIIAEYNPFHNGHAYQLKKAKELTGADYAVVVMSGNFVQRGIPALVDKYTRTRMALSGGADLVLELPVCYATASAEYFAKGAVSLLSSLGVDALCFGSECGNAESLHALAQIFAKEPAGFQAALEKHLQSGVSFPAARSLALKEYLVSRENIPEAEMENLISITESPNNILGIEYLKAISSLPASMAFYTIPRKGSGYADIRLKSHGFSSALAIRQSILGGCCLDDLAFCMPADSLQILQEELSSSLPVGEADFSGMLLYKLLSRQKEGYINYLDVSPALSDKIAGLLEQYVSWPQFCMLLKSRDLTHTRISRSLLHILLDITKKNLSEYNASGYSQYARILGFQKTAEPVFGNLRTDAIPLISKLADAEKQLSDLGKQQLLQDIFAAHLYEGIVAQKTGATLRNEYRRQIVIV